MGTLFEDGGRELRERRPEVALSLLAEAVRRTPSDHRARIAAARALGEMGQQERALLALHSTAEGLLRRDYLLSAILAVKFALRFNPTEKLLRTTLARIHARALEAAGKAEVPAVPPAEELGGERPGADLRELRGEELASQALAVLMAEDDGPRADLRRRPPLPLLSDLESAAFVDLVERMSVRELADGQPAIRQGETGASVFIVISGKARVVNEDPPRQFATLTGGALFGELSVLTGAPRSASVYAEGDMELFEISRDDLDFVSRSHPSVPKALAEFAQRRLAMNLLATAPLFTQLESAHRGPVLQRFRGRIVPAGERVISEGEPSAGLFLVLSGEFSVEKKDEAGQPIALKLLGDGEVFGEISLLSGGPASASVTAVRRSATAFLPRAAHDELVGSYRRSRTS